MLLNSNCIKISIQEHESKHFTCQYPLSPVFSSTKWNLPDLFHNYKEDKEILTIFYFFVFVKHFWLQKSCILNSVQIYVGHYKMFRQLTMRSILSSSLVIRREIFLRSIKHSFLSLEGAIFRLETVRHIVWKG